MDQEIFQLLEELRTADPFRQMEILRRIEQIRSVLTPGAEVVGRDTSQANATLPENFIDAAGRLNQPSVSEITSQTTDSLANDLRQRPLVSAPADTVGQVSPPSTRGAISQALDQFTEALRQQQPTVAPADATGVPTASGIAALLNPIQEQALGVSQQRVGPTIGDIRRRRTGTLADLLGPQQPPPRGDTGATFVRQPTTDPFAALGTTGREIALQAIRNREAALEEMQRRVQELLSEAEAFETGRLQVPPTGLARNIVFVSSPEEAQRVIEESGGTLIPVARRDVEPILQAARRQAEVLVRGAEEGVQEARQQERGAELQALAGGVGTVLASALGGVPAGFDLDELRRQATAARETLSRAMQRRREALTEAERLQSRALIDAAVSELEPLQTVQQLVFQEQFDRATRQLRAAEERRSAAAQIEAQRQRLLQEEPAFLERLRKIITPEPVPGRVVTPSEGGAERTSSTLLPQLFSSTLGGAVRAVQQIAQSREVKRREDVNALVGALQDAINDAQSLLARREFPEDPRAIEMFNAATRIRNALVSVEDPEDARDLINNPPPELKRDFDLLVTPVGFGPESPGVRMPNLQEEIRRKFF